jgi:hypothetical protein
MKTRQVIEGGLLLTGALLIGCAGEATQTGNIVWATCGADYRCVRDQMFHYRQQARELGSMAERYEREAAIHAKEFGQDSDQAKQSWALAEKFWMQAREADHLAHEFLYQLPHMAY